MQKLLFVYDRLMTTAEQELLRIKMEFLSYGQIKGKMYWFDDDKKKRIFAVPGKTTKVIYGGLFKVEEYELQKHRLHAYYYNAFPFTGKKLVEDFFSLADTQVIPIRFAALTDLKTGKYTKGVPIECEVFLGNPLNPRIQYNSSKRYYKLSGLDTQNFITMIEDQNGKQNV